MNASSLNALIELATEQRDAAANTLGTLRGNHSRAQAQLDALMAYRREYAERLQQAMAEGVSMHRLDNDQRFLRTLDDAIAQQQRVVASNEKQVEHGATHWRERQRRLKSFDALAERDERIAARAELRREQRISDEAAGRIARRATS